jgi:hypothetical protein
VGHRFAETKGPAEAGLKLLQIKGNAVSLIYRVRDR